MESVAYVILSCLANSSTGITIDLTKSVLDPVSLNAPKTSSKATEIEKSFQQYLGVLGVSKIGSVAIKLGQGNIKASPSTLSLLGNQEGNVQSMLSALDSAIDGKDQTLLNKLVNTFWDLFLKSNKK